MEKKIEQQLLEFQKKVGVIKKDAKNPHFKNTYASLTQILSEVKPLLSEFGLLLMQPINERGVGTQIMLPGDNEVCIESFIQLPSNLSPQQLGSAITYFRRYTLASLLALEIDDDDAEGTKKTIEQKVTEAKKLLDAANANNMGTIWKSLPIEMQNNEDVKLYGIDIKAKLGIK